MKITPKNNGTYTVQGIDCRLQACSRVRGHDGELRFGDAEAADGAVGGVSGTIRTDTGHGRGFSLQREFFTAENGSLCGLRLIMINTGRQNLKVDKLIPVSGSGPDSLIAAGTGLADWHIIRMSRHKNDVPGAYRPSVQDDDYDHAMVASAGFRAGMGVMFDEEGHHDDWPLGIDSEPLVCIANAADNSRQALCIAVLGQTEHMSHTTITAEEGFRQLAGFSVGAEFDGTILPPGEQFRTHWVLFWEQAEAQDGLTHYGELLAQETGLAVPAGPVPVTYCSWYFYGPDFTQADLEENLAALAENPVPIDAFVIDYGWMTTFGDWDENFERFPDGMAHAADLIRQAGMRPGIWTCPFVIEKGTRTLEAHPSLAARDRNTGEPLPFRCGHPDCYPLDVTDPYAEEYFKEFYARLRGWGYDFHKFDYLRALVANENIQFQDLSVNRAQAHRRGLELMRAGLGDDAYMLACGGLLENGIGLVDGQRSGSDVRGRWSEPDGVQEAGYIVRIKQNFFRNHQNRWWHTDADALQLRRRGEPFREQEHFEHLSTGRFTDEEAFTIVVNQFLGGGMVTICERMVELPDDRRQLYKHIMPAGYAPPARMLDPEHPICPSLLLTDMSDAAPEPYWILSAGNWADEETEKDIFLEAIPHEGPMAVFEFRTQQFLGLMKSDEIITLPMPPHAMRILRITPYDGKPILLGTDGHLSQGAAELKEYTFENGSLRAVRSENWRHPLILTYGVSEGEELKVLKEEIQGSKG